MNKYFSEQELYGLHAKAKAVLISNTIREGFKPRSFIVDSGRPLPYTVQFANSGKCSCNCVFFNRNNVCHHCIAVAMRAGKLDDLVASFSTRSLNQITTSTAPASVGSKRPPRKRKRRALDITVSWRNHSSDYEEQEAGRSHSQRTACPQKDCWRSAKLSRL